jgi:hypothetical protein
MELLHYGTIALAALMVWLLYRVTRETRQFMALDKRRVFRRIRPAAASEPHTPGVKTRRS